MYETDDNDKYSLLNVEKNVDTIIEYIDKDHKVNNNQGDDDKINI